MPAQWTGELIGIMHNKGITRKALAAQLGLHEKYVITVLSGKREPKNAETRFRAALEELVAERGSG